MALVRTGCGLQSKSRRGRRGAWYGEGRGGFPAACFTRRARRTVTQRRQRATGEGEGAAEAAEAGQRGQTPSERGSVARRLGGGDRPARGPGSIQGNTTKPTKYRRRWGDAGWLRGQTTRRRIHRRSDGGPERRQVLRRGTRAPCAWYTETPPCTSRPVSAVALFFLTTYAAVHTGESSPPGLSGGRIRDYAPSPLRRSAGRWLSTPLPVESSAGGW
jgi:hypothetical protein